jgi:hypothetical protein
MSSKISFELLKENLDKKAQKALIKQKFEKLGPVTRGLVHLDKRVSTSNNLRG